LVSKSVSMATPIRLRPLMRKHGSTGELGRRCHVFEIRAILRCDRVQSRTGRGLAELVRSSGAATGSGTERNNYDGDS